MYSHIGIGHGLQLTTTLFTLGVEFVGVTQSLEEHSCIRNAESLNSVAIEVDNQRVDACGPKHPLCKASGCCR